MKNSDDGKLRCSGQATRATIQRFDAYSAQGHLLLEESIDALLAALLQNPAARHPARLSVFARLCRVGALIPLSNDEMMKAAEGLNTLRNKLAHHLEHPQVEHLTNDFLYQFKIPTICILMILRTLIAFPSRGD